MNVTRPKFLVSEHSKADNDAARWGSSHPCSPWRTVDVRPEHQPSGCLSVHHNSSFRSPHPGYSPTHTMASPPPVEDQARLLEDALAVVRQQTMLMRRCLEIPGKLMDALKHRWELLYSYI